MLRIYGLSGQLILEQKRGQLDRWGQLKELLQQRTGVPRFRQRLLCGDQDVTRYM